MAYLQRPGESRQRMQFELDRLVGVAANLDLASML